MLSRRTLTQAPSTAVLSLSCPVSKPSLFDVLCTFWLSVGKGATSRGGGNRSVKQKENK